MKNLFGATLRGATLGALLLAAPVIATAAPAGQPAEVVGVASTPYTYGNGDSEAMPVFNYKKSGGDPPTISTPYTLGNRGSNQAPVFQYRGAAPLTVMFNRDGRIVLPEGVPALVNRTGDGR